MQQVVQRDLVSEITLLLKNNGHPNPSFWESEINTEARTHEIESIRRFIINQYWRDQLGKIDLQGLGNTIGDRFCLIEDGNIDDWLHLFNQKVVKAIVKYKIGF